MADETMVQELKALADLYKEANVKSAQDLDNLKSEHKERFEKIDAQFQEQEKQNKELTAQVIAEQKKADEIKDRLHEAELKLARAPRGKGQKAASAELKAFEKWVLGGRESMTADEIKTLNTNVATQGGVLVPDEISTDIIKDITEISPIRQIARVRNTDSMQYRQIVRKGTPTAYRTGELGQRSKSESSYGEEIVNLNAYTAIVGISEQLLETAAFNMEAEIMADVREQFAFAEGEDFVSGNGNNRPDGFLLDTRINQRTSNTDNALEAVDLINLAGDLKTGYNPVYVLNRRTLAYVRGLQASDGSFLWGSGLSAGLPNTINGYSYVEANDMPDVADGTLPIAFGDFSQGYLVIDKDGMVALRDPYTQKDFGIVEYSYRKFTGGKVIKPEAIKLLKIQ